MAFLALLTISSVAGGEVQAPIQYQRSEMAVISNNSLQSISPLFFPKTQVLGAIISSQNDSYWNVWEIYDRYPEMAEDLVCLYEKESTYGARLEGDLKNGVYMARGPFQIWTSKHPDVSEEYVMDFSCALDWTAKQIRADRGYWWTPILKGQCFKNYMNKNAPQSSN